MRDFINMDVLMKAAASSSLRSTRSAAQVAAKTRDVGHGEPSSCPARPTSCSWHSPHPGEAAMLQWVSKLLAGVTIDVPAGVPAAWVARVEMLLRPLDADKTKTARPGLSRDVLSYVLQGEPISILSEFASNRTLAELVQDRNYGDRKASDELYEGFEDLPGDVTLRWARFLDAIVTSLNRTHGFVFPGGIHWPEALLLHATGRMQYYSSDAHVPRGLSALAFEKVSARIEL